MTPDEIKTQAEEVAHRVWDEQSGHWQVYPFGAECFRRGVLYALNEARRDVYLSATNGPVVDAYDIDHIITAARGAGK